MASNRPRVPRAASTPVQLADAVNMALSGQIDATVVVTLTPNADSTTVADSRIGPTTCAGLTPNTAHAAAALATTYVPLNTIGGGALVLQHANNAQDDRTFTLSLVG